MAWLLAGYGMILGSFATLVGIRIPRGESMVAPGSHCEGCKRPLAWFELIPLFSWIGLGGRCRTCGYRVPWMYPLIELISGVVFFIAWYQWHWGIGFWIAAWTCIGFIAITVADFDQFRIPDAFLVPMAVVLLALRAFDHPLPFWSYVLGSLLAMIILWGIRIVSRGGMGLGDVKMFGYVGLLVGISGMVVTLVLASALGVLAGAALWIGKRLPDDHRVPFGPAIAVAAMGVYLYGSGSLHGYWWVLLHG